MFSIDELKKLLGTGNVIVINNLTVNVTDDSTHVSIEPLHAPVPPAQRQLYPWSDWDKASRDYADECRRYRWAHDHDDHGYLG
jgi:hypothetical protein